jgi:hypothetical protein
MFIFLLDYFGTSPEKSRVTQSIRMKTARKYDPHLSDLRTASFGFLKHVKTRPMLLYPSG